jgi:hypothetical protein
MASALKLQSRKFQSGHLQSGNLQVACALAAPHTHIPECGLTVYATDIVHTVTSNRLRTDCSGNGRAERRLVDNAQTRGKSAQNSFTGGPQNAQFSPAAPWDIHLLLRGTPIWKWFNRYDAAIAATFQLTGPPIVNAQNTDKSAQHIACGIQK